MENIPFYDFITFVTNILGVRLLFGNSYHSCLKLIKNMIFKTSNLPTDGITDFGMALAEHCNFRFLLFRCTYRLIKSLFLWNTQ